MAHKGIPKLVAPVLFITILYTLQLCTSTKAYLQSSLAIIPIQVGKCAYYSNIILTKIESLLCSNYAGIIYHGVLIKHIECSDVLVQC